MKITLTREYVINNINKKFKDELNEPGEKIKVIKPEEDYQGEWPPKEFIDIVKKRYNKPIVIFNYNGGHDMMYFFYDYNLSDCFAEPRGDGLSGEDIFNNIFHLDNFGDEDGESDILGKVDEGYTHTETTMDDMTVIEDDESYSINDYYAYVGNYDSKYVFQLDDDGKIYLPDFDKLEFEIDEDELIDTPLTREWRLKELDGEEIIL